MQVDVARRGRRIRSAAGRVVLAAGLLAASAGLGPVQPARAAEGLGGWSLDPLVVGTAAPPLLEWPSMAVDRTGNVVVAAVRSSADLASGGLAIYRRSAGDAGTWTRLAVTSAQDREPSLALNASGRVSVAFLREGVGLRYTSNRTGTWVVEPLAGTREALMPSLALTSGGTPAIAYERHSGRATLGISLLYKTSTGWRTRTVTTGDDHAPSLAIDQYGVRYLAFVRTSGARGLWFGTDRGGTWRFTRLTSATDVQAPSLALDLWRHVHVAYERHGATSSRVLEVTNVAGSWRTTTVSDGRGGVAPAMAVAATDVPIVSVAYMTDPRMAPAVPLVATQDTLAWSRSQVSATAFDTANRPGFAIERSGRRHLALYEPNAIGEFSLVHATLAP